MDSVDLIYFIFRYKFMFFFLDNAMIFNNSSNSAALLPHERVVINISGMRFETHLSTINQFPKTLLGDSVKRERHFDYMNNEYFFERHRASFESILFYYQSNGRFLSRPINVSPEIFFDEIIFFQLGMWSALVVCFVFFCLVLIIRILILFKPSAGEEAIDRYKKAEGYLLDKQAKLKDLPKNKILCSIWLLFEFPDSSLYARVIAIISLVAIWLSIGLFCIETLPKIKNRRSKLIKDEFFIVETICIIWFTIELLLRFISSPCKKKFIKHPGNIIDFFSLLPYVLQVSDISDKLAILRMIRLIRVFRIFKLARHFKGLQILIQTFKASAKELALLGIFLMIGVVLFSSCVFFFEMEVLNTDFDSIPDGFWYALVTMTTVSVTKNSTNIFYYLYFSFPRWVTVIWYPSQQLVAYSVVYVL